mgnify:CR=1 FL=1
MVQIGTIKSIGHTDGLSIIPDDRQTLVKTVNQNGAGSVTVEDYGVVDDGEVVSFSAVFSSSDYNALVTLWKNRTAVTVTLEDGTVIASARVVLKSAAYFDVLLPGYKKVSMEVWRV